MSKAYYNGYVLPTLPAECGSTNYPIAYFSLSLGCVYLVAVDTLGYVDTDVTFAQSYTTTNGTTLNFMTWVAALNEERAAENQDDYPGISTTEWLFIEKTSSQAIAANTGVKWSNVPLADQNGAELIAGSNPINLNLVCGDSAAWDYDNIQNTLIISGAGATYDYNWKTENYPWSLLKEDITSILVNEGITRIGNANFHGFNNITTINATENFPGSLLEIGDRCFGSCHSLTSIIFVSSIKKIGGWCLAECWDLTSVTLPANLQEIGGSVFQTTTNLQEIIIDNDYFTVVNNILFNKDQTTIIHYPAKSSTATTYSIPNTVTKIDESCFWGNQYLDSILIPTTVTEIGSYAFSGVSNLKVITIPAAVNTLNYHTFNKNNNLQWIKILSSTPITVDENTIILENCPNLTKIYVPAGCAEAYKATEGWATYSHLIQELAATSFDLKLWTTGFIYGLTGQPLPLPAEKLTVEVLNNNVLYITKANNVIVNAPLLEVL